MSPVMMVDFAMATAEDERRTQLKQARGEVVHDDDMIGCQCAPCAEELEAYRTLNALEAMGEDRLVYARSHIEGMLKEMDKLERASSGTTDSMRALDRAFKIAMSDLMDIAVRNRDRANASSARWVLKGGGSVC